VCTSTDLQPPGVSRHPVFASGQKPGEVHRTTLSSLARVDREGREVHCTARAAGSMEADGAGAASEDRRFEVELEFVQCLANPEYLHFLAQRVSRPRIHPLIYTAMFECIQLAPPPPYLPCALSLSSTASHRRRIIARCFQRSCIALPWPVLLRKTLCALRSAAEHALRG
jgi:hypothetical protein